jgi:WD40 repeat protein
MNFSDSIQQSGGLVKYSPNGAFVAIAKAFDVKVSYTSTLTYFKLFETQSLKPLVTHSFSDLVSQIEWSKDGNLILIGVEKRGLAFAKSVHDPDWTCRVDEGLAGLAFCKWAPTSRHILTVSEFKLKLTIWSLIDQSVQYISFPKQESTGIDFSPDGKLMAVALKGDEQTASTSDKFANDVIAIFSVSQK